MKHAIKHGYIQTNPFSFVETPKQKNSSNKDRYYSREELITFLEATKKEHRPYMHVFYRLLSYAGLRKSECLALHWDDIDFQNYEIHVTKAISTDGDNNLYLKVPKTGETRVIKMDHVTMEILMNWKNNQKRTLDLLNMYSPKQLVFSNTENQLIQPSFTWKWGHSIQSKYNIKELSPHGFRHTHSTLLTEAGVSLVGIQQRLGHSGNDTTTKTYIHNTDKIKTDTVNKFVDYMDY